MKDGHGRGLRKGRGVYLSGTPVGVTLLGDISFVSISALHGAAVCSFYVCDGRGEFVGGRNESHGGSMINPGTQPRPKKKGTDQKKMFKGTATERKYTCREEKHTPRLPKAIIGKKNIAEKLTHTTTSTQLGQFSGVLRKIVMRRSVIHNLLYFTK